MFFRLCLILLLKNVVDPDSSNNLHDIVNCRLLLISRSQRLSQATSRILCTNTDITFVRRLLRNVLIWSWGRPMGISPRGGYMIQALPGPCFWSSNSHLRWKSCAIVQQIIPASESTLFTEDLLFERCDWNQLIHTYKNYIFIRITRFSWIN